MTVNLFGRARAIEQSLDKIAAAFGADVDLGLQADARRQHRGAGPAHADAARARRAAAARADVIESRWDLPADKWLRLFKPVCETICTAMRKVTP